MIASATQCMRQNTKNKSTWADPTRGQKKEAKAAKNKCMGIQSKGSKQKEDLVWWALALVISGVVLFAIVGAIVHARNR